MKTALVIEKKQTQPILIVDKTSPIGFDLALKLQSESLVVLVSNESKEIHDNIVHIPYTKKFPSIPNNIYSHIFVIDDGTSDTRKYIDAFIKKSEENDSVFIFITSLDEVEEKTIEKIVLYKKGNVLIHGDIFAKDFIFDLKTHVNQFLYQAQLYGKIEVPGDGLRPTYPVYYNDVLDKIEEVIFANPQKSQVCYLFPKHALSLMSLAHAIQKTNPDIKIDFTKNDKYPGRDLKFEIGSFVFGEEYPIVQKLREVKIKEKKDEEKERIVIAKDNKRKINKLPIVGFILLFIFFLSLPLLFTFGLSYAGLNFLNSARTSINKGDLTKAASDIEFAKNSFLGAKKSVATLSTQAGLIGQKQMVDPLINDVNAGYNISLAGTYLVEASSLVNDILTSKAKDPSNNFKEASSNFKNALVIFQKEKIEDPRFQDLADKINVISDFAATTIDVWPDLLGFNGKKEYLLLFQNNMELRPGGGFIGSYGILTLENGKVLDFTINDVYDADGQLKGHVEPPFPIRRHLPSEHWYLRDSNFNVDFSKAASEAAKFLFLEKNKRVNGVIGVDVTFVQKLVSAIGEVNVAEYKEKVTGENLYELTQVHAEKNFFPGSTQKKDFLRSLFSAIQTKLSDKENLPYLDIAQAFGEALQEKHVLFAFDESNLQNLFTVNGWSSSLWDNRKEDRRNIKDFFGISEANLGVNKANYFVRRSISKKTNIADDGEIKSSVTIAYKNVNENNVWPGGAYKNYLRVILPKNAEILDIYIDEKRQEIVPAVTNPLTYESRNFKPPLGLEMDRQEEGDKTTYGFVVTTAPGALMTIEVSYSIPQKAPISLSSFTYNLRFFKQPGTENYPFDLSVTYPENWTTSFVSEKSNTMENGLTIPSDASRDKDYIINFSKK